LNNSIRLGNTYACTLWNAKVTHFYSYSFDIVLDLLADLSRPDKYNVCLYYQFMCRVYQYWAYPFSCFTSNTVGFKRLTLVLELITKTILLGTRVVYWP